MGIVIKVENLGKKYIISHQQERYTALRDVMTNTAKKAVKKVIGKSETLPKKEEFWALRNIDFEVNAGDRIGIIGRNGAGKSTLLKLLSKITEPTEGKIKIKGKIASLLEVGTGFHNELTGKENIMLNGAILGMSKKEILKKFDEIVDFSGVEKFLDTPVKRYSSGMYVRLAFAVAAHLETEILLIDEVLAVGDAEFQKKCLGRMDDISKNEGRTILFVSHNMGAIANLCSNALLLYEGGIVLQDKTNIVIEYYQNQYKSTTSEFKNYLSTNKEMFVKNALILDRNGEKKGNFAHDEDISIKVHCKVNYLLKGVELRMILKNTKGNIVFITDIELTSLDSSMREFVASIVIPSNTLRPNEYNVSLALFVPNLLVIELIEDILLFSVFDNGTKYAVSDGVDYGSIFSPCKIELIQNTNVIK